jgi:hypothetical protein
MMPHTVPNRPTKGATEPTVARKFSRSASASPRRHRACPSPGEPLARALAVDLARPENGAIRPARLPRGRASRLPFSFWNASSRARPEFGSIVALALDAAHLDPEADDDRPDPDAGEHQPPITAFTTMSA